MLLNNTCNSNSDNGIHLSSSTATLLNNTCNSNSDEGIFIASSSITLKNNTLSDNNEGLYIISSSSNTIINNTFSNNNDGILLTSSTNSNTIGNNTFSNNYYGIRLSSSNSNLIVNNTCSSNNESIHLYNSDSNTFLKNILIDNPIGINLTSGSDDCYITNTSIINSTASDIQLDGDSHAFALNCSLKWSNIDYIDDVSNLTVQWYLHVNVTNGTGDPVSNASSVIKDNYTNQIYTGNTDPTGYCRWITCSQYVEDITGLIEIHTPHNISVSKTPHEGFAEPVMSTSRIVSIVLHQDVTSPEPPTNLIFDTVQGNFINMSWSASSSFDVMGYNVYINDTGTSSTFHFLNSTNACYFNATDLNEETTYYFIIKAYDDVPLESLNLSGYNTTLDFTPPAPPTSLICSLVGGSFINLTWVASVSPDVEGYQIYINDTGSSVDFHYLTETLECYFNHTGLPEETTYYFKVRAFDEVLLYSVFSNTAGTTTLDITIPAPPTSVTCSSVGGTYINLSWTASVSTDIDGYDIYVNDTGSTANFHYLANTTNCYFNHTGLYEEITYYYKIKAFDEVPLTSVFSNIFSTTTLDVTAPVAPTGVVAKDPTGSTITIDWNSNPESDIHGYKVYINGSGTGQTGPYFMIADISGFPSPPTQHSVVGLHQEIRYYFYVTAYDEVPNESPWSVIVDEKTLDVTAPTAPTNLQAQAQVSRKISLTWNSNPEQDVEGYFVYMNDTNNGPTGSFHLIYETPDLGTSYTVLDLAEKTTYHFKVVAFDEVPNNSSFSNHASATTFDETSPIAPTGLAIIDPTSSSLKIVWDANPEIDVFGYSIFRASSEFGTYDQINSQPITNTFYVDTGLQEVTRYYYKALATDAVSLESPFSAVVSGVTILGPHGPEINNSINDFEIIEDTYDDTSLNLYHMFKDINYDSLTFWCEGQDKIGVTIFESNGTVTFKPELNWNGMESLTFYASDSTFEISDEINITITPVNDPPGHATIVKPAEGHTVGDGKTIGFEAQCNDKDIVYGDELSFTWLSNISGHIGGSRVMTEVFLPIGVHQIILIVTDRHGFSSTASIIVTVKETSLSDSDGDGIPNIWERENGFDPNDPKDAALDSDEDGVSNIDEYKAGTNPHGEGPAKDEPSDDTDNPDPTNDTTDDDPTSDPDQPGDSTSDINDTTIPSKSSSSPTTLAAIIIVILVVALLAALWFLKKPPFGKVSAEPLSEGQPPVQPPVQAKPPVQPLVQPQPPAQPPPLTPPPTPEPEMSLDDAAAAFMEQS